MRRLSRFVMWLSVAAFFVCLATGGVLSIQIESRSPHLANPENGQVIAFPWRGQTYYITRQQETLIDATELGAFVSFALVVVTYAKTAGAKGWIRGQSE